MSERIAAREQLILSLLPIAKSLSRRYKDTAGWLDWQDLLQEGMIGAMRAVDTYEDRGGCRTMRETARALDAYRCYERLGPQRSLDAVAQELAKSLPLIKRWSAAHAWRERVAAYDAALAARDEAEQAERRKKAREQRLQVARGARSKGVEALTTLTAQDLARLPSALVRLLEYADSTERKDLGEPDQRVEVAGPSGGDITVRVIYDDGNSAAEPSL